MYTSAETDSICCVGVIPWSKYTYFGLYCIRIRSIAFQNCFSVDFVFKPIKFEARKSILMYKFKMNKFLYFSIKFKYINRYKSCMYDITTVWISLSIFS